MPPAAPLRWSGGETVDIVHERVAGLDVHRKIILACVRVVVDGKVIFKPGVSRFLKGRGA